MPHRGKLPVEKKIEVVESIMRGETNSYRVSKEYGLSKSTVINWLRLYELYRREGPSPVQRNKKYAAQVKLQAVEEYLAGGVSYADLCLKYKIGSPALFRRWLRGMDHGKERKNPRKHPSNGNEKRQASHFHFLLERMSVDIPSFLYSLLLFSCVYLTGSSSVFL